jgi:hypothetical protein
MNSNSTFRIRIALQIIACLGTGGLALAQQASGPAQVNIKVSELKLAMQKTPVFTAAGVEAKKDGKAREWLEAEIEFEAATAPRGAVIPEVMVQYYFAVKGTTPQIITDSFTYTNVLDKEPSFAVVYVSPTGLARVNGEMGKFKVSDVVAWGAEVLFNGRVVGQFSNNGGAWWTSAPQPRVSGLLMAKEDTPYRLLWIDRHLEVKR